MTTAQTDQYAHAIRGSISYLYISSLFSRASLYHLCFISVSSLSPFPLSLSLFMFLFLFLFLSLSHLSARGVNDIRPNGEGGEGGSINDFIRRRTVVAVETETVSLGEKLVEGEGSLNTERLLLNDFSKRKERIE